jgi:hypothetical protein
VSFVGDVILPERLALIDIIGHAGYMIIPVDELVRTVETRHVIHKCDKLRIILAVVNDRKHTVVCDRAFLGDEVGAWHAIDCLTGELEVEPKVVGDVHHQRASPDAA